MGELKTVDIKGKDYVMVNERIKAFRENYKGYSLVSEILSMENGIVTMKASILDDNGCVVATGHAQEKEQSSSINKTSYVENCETSAFGRALGNFGIGIDTSFATADEVANAIKQQGDLKKQKEEQKKEQSQKADAINEGFQQTMDNVERATDEQLTKIKEACFAINYEEKNILEAFKVTALEDMTPTQAENCLKRLNAKADGVA